MGELRRTGPPSKPGPYLRDLVHELRAARDGVDEVATLAATVEPPLPQQLGGYEAEELTQHLAVALIELDAALMIVEAARA